ncbi:MAG: hypothetical protein HYX94_05335 [Chloroflexi bacterium]|nr:hypothetical protein [Chloroflexota bacterium]
MSEYSQELMLQVYSRARFDTNERAREIVNYLLSSRPFAPNRFGECEPLRSLTPELVDKAVALLSAEAKQRRNPDRVISTLFFERTRKPFCSYTVEWIKLPHEAFSRSRYYVEDSFVIEQGNLSLWLKFCCGLLGLHDAWYAMLALDSETKHKNFLSRRVQHPRARDKNKGVETVGGVGYTLTEGIPGVYWGNYFGKFYVEWFGREKFDSLPCVEKRWLDTGGIFFTTALSPFDWDTPAARDMQLAVKKHLGMDAFFDFETVRRMIGEFEPIPEDMEPEQFQPPRRLPDFPFKLQALESRTIEREIEDTQHYFEEHGFKLESIEGKVLVFSDDKGGKTCVTVGPGGSVEYWPNL